MARQPSAQQLYEELLERFGKRIADAFMAAIQDLRDAADLQRVIAAIEQGNIEAALEALHIDPAAYGEVLDSISQGYTEAGKVTASGLPSRNPAGAAVVVRFDARNPRAEEWLRTYGAELVTRVIEDQRTAVRQAIVAGMEVGQNPRTTALDIVGRVNKATGKRDGSIIGLTAQQEAFARNAEAELRSGDPAQIANYFQRQRRDKRFDRTIQKALKDETPVPAATIQKALIQYRNQLLRLRGQVIGRTEALTSLNAAQYEALQQAVDTGQIQANQIRRVWKSAGDLRVRDSHRLLDGDTAGLEEPFRSPTGVTLRYPGDPLAPAAERISCRCWTMPRIDWAANVR